MSEEREPYDGDEETGATLRRAPGHPYERFVMVANWLVDEDISDRAFRLYAILQSYAGPGRHVFPARRKLADRLRTSLDSVDRAMKELVTAGAVTVLSRARVNGSQSSNEYVVHHESNASRTRAAGGAARVRLPSGGGTRAAPTLINQRDEQDRDQTVREGSALLDNKQSMTVNGQGNRATIDLPRAGHNPQATVKQKRVDKPLTDEQRAKIVADFGSRVPNIEQEIAYALDHVAASKSTDKNLYLRRWMAREVERKERGTNGQQQRPQSRRGQLPLLHYTPDEAREHNERELARFLDGGAPASP